MLGLLNHIDTKDIRRLSVGNMTVFNLERLTHRPEGITPSSGTFRLWVSQVMAQAMRFIVSPYATEGVSPRDDWAFWAPIFVSNRKHDAIFTARWNVNAKVWRYGLYFYGNDQWLHNRLGRCVLVARTSERTDRRIVRRPHLDKEAGTLVTSFELAAGETRGAHVLTFVDAA